MSNDIKKIHIQILEIVKNKPHTITSLSGMQKKSYDYLWRVTREMIDAKLIRSVGGFDKREKLLICEPKGIIHLRKNRARVNFFIVMNKKLLKLDEKIDKEIKNLMGYEE